MYFADEIRPSKDIPPKRVKVDKRELEMAETLIDRFTTHFDHDRYEDEYQRRLREVVKRKRKGEEIHAAAPEEREAPSDLLDALRASVEAAKRSQNGRTKAKRNENGGARARPKRSRKKRATTKR
jgi:DNA end-binding protein Ku